MPVVNIYKSTYDVYVGRPGKGLDGRFGNPVRAGRPCPVCDAVHPSPVSTLPCYEVYLRERVKCDPEFRSDVASLHGKVLGCFCKPRPCHGDILEAVCSEIVHGSV
jgi:hypothetical protein